MKKFFIIWSLLISTISFDLLAQENVAVTIDKVIENGKIYVITTVTNNNEHSIGIFNRAIVDGNGNVIDESLSYLVFSGYTYFPQSKEYSLVEKSKHVFFSRTGVEVNPRKSILIEKGEPFVDRHLLFMDKTSVFYTFPFKVFDKRIENKINHIQITAHLTYFYASPIKSEAKGYQKDFTSNRLDL